MGIWDDSDAINPDTGMLYEPNDPETTKLLSTSLEELLARGIYIQVHTNQFEGGEIRGQVITISYIWATHLYLIL